MNVPDYALMQDENDEAADEDPDMEGELTSADYRKLQSLVDEQEQAVQAGDDILLDLLVFLLAPSPKLLLCRSTLLLYASIATLDKCLLSATSNIP